ncbi:2'-5'-oligoadenylate synthase 1A-like [Patiria miniata]|uniref:2'-5'-oligoadenylate synthetase 1 domain-containing protein n=1 Tax=Patiria miniata TaxID=46514 RepID=A0A914BJN5_PATMI|nr:2'-5'-oligoadenylate synthase 1A-like [Patiria miniata]XP_038076126.1 2'-5'-oligoadenylate synthase 1A-like [Patiria miniata]
MGNWFSTGPEPWCLDPSSLERWYITNILEGTQKFNSDCSEAVDRLLGSLNIKCVTAGKNLLDTPDVIKGGSLGKGTMIGGLSEVDLVAYINPSHLAPICSSSTQDYRTQLKAVIDELKKALGRLKNVGIRRSDAYTISFVIEVTGRRFLEVDLLPTAENFHGYGLGPSDIYKEMLQLSGYDRGFYSASLVKFQWDFVKNQPGYVKELISLVKFWACTSLPRALQKSYPLELITIYRWENAGKPAYFSKAQGLKDILKAMTALQVLRHFWTDMYDADLAEQAITKLGHRNPILLDPANPTNNACWVYQKGDDIDVIAKAAESSLQTVLLRDVIVYANWSGRITSE